jgi:hypothetical protein
VRALTRRPATRSWRRYAPAGSLAPLRAGMTAAVAAGAARAAYTALQVRPPGGAKTWTRTNHRGEPVTLLEGPAAAAGAVIGAALAPGTPGRARAAVALAGTAAAAFGALDDLVASPGEPKGFRGHLGALRRGQLTTGAVKLGGIGLTGLAAATALGGSPGGTAAGAGAGRGAGRGTGTAAGTVAGTAVNAALIAGSANLLNLFDLRPGRAAKVAAAAGVALCGAEPLAAAPAGGALALAGEDLGERAMLGDAGANALGAMLGAAAAARLSRRARAGLLAGVIALTAASEVVSFTRVIERTPPLRWLDLLGRRPALPRAAQAPQTGAPQTGAPQTGAPQTGAPHAGAPSTETPSGRAWPGRSQTSG